MHRELGRNLGMDMKQGSLTLHASTFSGIGAMQLLTPDEFVAAGDHLVSTVGSWAW
jgi:hypothetical protein